MTSGHYVRASGHGRGISNYDRAIALTMREKAWRPDLTEAVALSAPQGGTVVEVGAGTGTLAIALAGARADLHVIAVDGDAEILDLARGKPGADRVDWREGRAGELPLGDGEADAALMSLLLHHLLPDAKTRALEEARRVLGENGTLHVADFGRGQDPVMRFAFRRLQQLDGEPNTADHAAGNLPRFIERAGFSRQERWRRMRTLWGTFELIRAQASR